MAYLETTETGMDYESYITGPQGAHYILYPNPSHCKHCINYAKWWIRHNLDAVSIKIRKDENRI